MLRKLRNLDYINMCVFINVVTKNYLNIILRKSQKYNPGKKVKNVYLSFTTLLKIISKGFQSFGGLH